MLRKRFAYGVLVISLVACAHSAPQPPDATPASMASTAAPTAHPSSSEPNAGAKGTGAQLRFAWPSGVVAAMPCHAGQSEARCVTLTRTIYITPEIAKQTLEVTNARNRKERPKAALVYDHLAFEKRAILVAEIDTFLPHRHEVTTTLDMRGSAGGKPRELKQRTQTVVSYTYEARP